ncbi:hypothetical protein DL766_000471 [Monosporascus sp. MC13-8B]|uniref:SnoaL-like domain-containing protein n=1 Tax=Monosporascus cannonballus TaxID=155416 RepID=A0ABY0GVA5_9PEZI|nr:hypothetical protein DL762_010418 [Monosporascus cannonballus]RYO89635.1 hypothetical protein DL763_005585 [Monosporascus cannonballus]RYP39213.1 hypothetical protein DL766_000471 [Monosporascus sp. MC13-8B]
MESVPSARISTVNALLDGYGSLSIAQLLEPLAAEFRHQVLPESLQMEQCDKESFAKKAEGIFGIFAEFQMIPQSIAEDAKRGMVIVHAHMDGTFKNGSGKWKNECVMIIQLSPDGTKVLEIREFVDSAKALEMRKKHAPKDF